MLIMIYHYLVKIGKKVMKEYISKEEKQELENLYQTYLNDPKVKRMQDIRIHRGSNCYIHCFKVAKLAIKRAIKRKKKLDLKAILVGAILHDYYLYDWRTNKKLKKKHAKNHPKIAAANARKDFNISPLVNDIILTHMWPYNFKMFPKTTEARIVMNADNHIATKEALTSIKYKSKRIDKYMDYIKSLF